MPFDGELIESEMSRLDLTRHFSNKVVSNERMTAKVFYNHQQFSAHQKPTMMHSQAVLQLQASESSEEVFVSHLEDLKQIIEDRFGQLANKLQDLECKYVELSQQVHSTPVAQLSASTSVQEPVAYSSFRQALNVPPLAPARFASESLADPFNASMDVERTLTHSPTPIGRSHEEVPKVGTGNEAYEARDIFHRHPVEGNLKKISTLQLRPILNEFNSIHFDPKVETAAEFLARFEDRRKKLHSANPNILSPVYIKIIFEIAIDKTATYRKAELHNFKFTIAELSDMLLAENMSEPSGANSSTGRSNIASTHGHGGGKRGGGALKFSKPGSNLQKKSTAPAKVTKKTHCVYCKRRGHTKEICFRAKKMCFKCGAANSHFAADCPSSNLPQKESVPGNESSSAAPDQNQPEDHFEANKSKLFMMPLGQAKLLSQEFQSRPDSVFAIAGPTSGRNDATTWVIMGAGEVQHVRRLNFMCEKQGLGQAFEMTEAQRSEILGSV